MASEHKHDDHDPSAIDKGQILRIGKKNVFERSPSEEKIITLFFFPSRWRLQTMIIYPIIHSLS